MAFKIVRTKVMLNNNNNNIFKGTPSKYNRNAEIGYERNFEQCQLVISRSSVLLDTARSSIPLYKTLLTVPFRSI